MFPSLGVELAKVFPPGVVAFDPPMASIPFENIAVRIAPSGASSRCEACLRLRPPRVRKTRKVARHPGGFVCRPAAQLVPLYIDLLIQAEV